MKTFHPLSFALGLASGVLVLIVVFGSIRLIHGGNPTFAAGTGRGNYGQQFGGGAGPNTARMAQRLGITQDELQKELDSGKTVQEIAAEHGVQFGGRGQGNGGPRSGSGTTTNTSSGSTTSSSTSQQ
jgi:hypothetical protein